MNKDFIIDDKFVKKLKCRNIDAFHELYNEFAIPMKLVCMRYIKVEADAEDVFQDGFLKIFTNINQLRNAEMLIAWMKRIFINTSLDFLKQKKSVDFTEDTPKNKLNTFSEEALIDEGFDSIGKTENIDYEIIRKVDFTQEELLETLNKIPDHYRVVFQLHVIDKIKHTEISKMIGIKEKTSKTRLLRARNLLKCEMQKIAAQKIMNE